MTREELKLINSSAEEEKIICADDLKPFLKDRTLLYGYTFDGRTHHVYLKNKIIHVVTYYVKNCNIDNIYPEDMKEIIVKDNKDYIPDRRLYPESCDYHFCKLLKDRSVNLPFTTYNERRPKIDFYGFTLEDI